jgi:hypothetical protein
MTGTPLDLVVTHLNASIGKVVSSDQLAAALKAGSLSAIADPLAAAAVAYLFVEISPALIARCARFTGADLVRVNCLYLETLEDRLPRVLAWEESVEHLL